MDIEPVTQWAQILTAAAAVSGVLYAIWHGERTLRAAVKPNVRFVLGNGVTPWIMIPYHRPKILAEELAASQDPKTAEPHSTLKNHGAGAATKITTSWTVTDVNGIDLAPKDRTSRCPVHPQDLMPGESAAIWSLPSFLIEGCEQEFTATCELVIEYDDKFGKRGIERVALTLRNKPTGRKDRESDVYIFRSEYHAYLVEQSGEHHLRKRTGRPGDEK